MRLPTARQVGAVNVIHRLGEDAGLVPSSMASVACDSRNSADPDNSAHSRTFVGQNGTSHVAHVNLHPLCEYRVLRGC